MGARDTRLARRATIQGDLSGRIACGPLYNLRVEEIFDQDYRHIFVGVPNDWASVLGPRDCRARLPGPGIDNAWWARPSFSIREPTGLGSTALI